MEKTLKRLTRIRLLGFLLSPLSLLFYLVIFGSLLVGGLFLTEIEMINRTEKVLQVTPYGKYQGVDEFSKAPMQRNAWPHFYLINKTDIELAPNKLTKISYDSDDHYIRGFLVKSDETLKIFPIESLELLNGVIEIKDIETLQIAPKGLVDTLYSKSNRSYIIRFLMIIGFINSVFLFVVQKRIRRIRNTVHNTR